MRARRSAVLGLESHLSSQRSNGLVSMIRRIRDMAGLALAEDEGSAAAESVNRCLRPVVSPPSFLGLMPF